MNLQDVDAWVWVNTLNILQIGYIGGSKAPGNEEMQKSSWKYVRDILQIV